MSGNDRTADLLEQTYFCALKVHVVIADLEVYSEEVYQRDIIAEGPASQWHSTQRNISPYTPVFVVPQAIISLIPILKRPPVSRTPREYVAGSPDTPDSLLLTMEIYSSSVGHTKESLQ